MGHARYAQGQQSVGVKHEKTFEFFGYAFSVATLQFYHHGRNATMESTERKCVVRLPIKVFYKTGNDAHSESHSGGGPLQQIKL